MVRPKTREEALRVMQERIAKKADEPNTDDRYDLQMVDVYLVTFIDKKSLLIPEFIGEKVKDALESDTVPSFVSFGSGSWRAYEFKSFIPVSVRFASLSEWAQHKILEERPDLFAEIQDRFSPRLKAYYERVKKGEHLSKDLKLLFEGKPWQGQAK